MTNNTVERREVRVFQVDYKCPKCGNGYLRPTGIVCSMNPPKRPHKCSNPDCDYAETIIGNAYPYIEFEPIEDSLMILYGNEVNFVHGKGDKEFCVDNEKVITVEPVIIREDRDVPHAINDYPYKPSGK